MTRNGRSGPAFFLYGHERGGNKDCGKPMERLGKSECIAAYLHAVRQMCQK